MADRVFTFINSLLNFQEIKDTIIDKIDPLEMKGSWLTMCVTLLQEKHKIKDSNIFDQGHACYLKQIDVFVLMIKIFMRF